MIYGDGNRNEWWSDDEGTTSHAYPPDRSIEHDKYRPPTGFLDSIVSSQKIDVRHEGAAGALASPQSDKNSTSPDFGAEIIQEEVQQVQRWARANNRDARRDRIHFWMLKIPAILGGLGASALDAFGYGPVVIILGFVTAACVAIDGLYPRGRLFNVHRRAANELFSLQDQLATKRNAIRLQTPDIVRQRELLSSLLVEIEKEKRRISQYLTVAEASLGEHDNQMK